MKVDFLSFVGDDVMQWIYEADYFFKIYDMPEHQNIDLVAVNLEGKTLAWFQLLEKTGQMTYWFSLSTAIQLQFGPSQFDNPWEDLLKLKQVNSVSNYFDAFNNLAARTYGMVDALLLDCFVGGLHPELRQDVKSRSAPSLLQAVALAKLFEDNFLPVLPRNRPPQLPFIPLAQQPLIPTQSPKPLATFPMPVPASTLLLPTPTKHPQLQKLSPIKIQFRRVNGLCFTCDEKFSFSHYCASKQYFIIQTLEDILVESHNGGEPIPVPDNDQESGVEAPETPHLSYNALSRVPSREFGHFIYPRLVKALKLVLHQAPPFAVEVGSGDLLHYEGEIKEVLVVVQDHCLCILAYLLPIASEELVLGDSWLKTLDTHLVNYREKFIMF
ncbi:hypothetical protein Ahy_B10g101081 [Arachis hypogaea]|uniref:Retrotransposon gag domain-containing protein n=1 Tax=Arachis hypogaea TaxID=3818 RepID=A0A444WYP5_ARAHY|nr:hypothetical protein Ahy_B10g101081 [Arachis hypogaea]